MNCELVTMCYVSWKNVLCQQGDVNCELGIMRYVSWEMCNVSWKS